MGADNTFGETNFNTEKPCNMYAVMRSANLLRENTEIRDQQHEMWAEGSCDDEPTKEEVIAFVKTLGWVGRCVEISFDGMQTVWRWSCDIAHL